MQAKNPIICFKCRIKLCKFHFFSREQYTHPINQLTRNEYTKLKNYRKLSSRKYLLNFSTRSSKKHFEEILRKFQTKFKNVRNSKIQVSIR